MIFPVLHCRFLTLLAAGLLSLPERVTADLPSPDYRESTVVLYNVGLPASRRLAGAYAKARQIPTGNLVGLALSPQETITRGEYNGALADPLRKIFTEKGWWKMGQGAEGVQVVSNTKRVLAVMSGVPLRITEEFNLEGPRDPNTGQPVAPPAGQQNNASVDSELTLLGVPGSNIAGGLNNPYYRKDEAFSNGAPPALMLVGRVDGPSFATCERMIADALATEKTGLWGRVYLDLARKGAGYDEGDNWIVAAGHAFGTGGWPVVIDAHPETLPTNYPMNDAAVYFGWYIRSPDGPFLNPSFKFRRGAVATHIHSFSATSIRGQSTEWCGPLLTKGACAVLGNTWEPYLTMTTQIHIFTDRLLKGYTLAEAAWMATPALSWMNVVLGDPLYRPFANRATTPAIRDSQDFQSYHALVAQHGGNEDHEALLKAVEAAATARKSGVLWEALGVLIQTYVPDDLKRAAGAFEKAARSYTRVSDKIRCYLQVPDLQRRNNQLDGAVADLRRIIYEYPKEPETEAARVWLTRLKPQAAPPPDPPSPRGRKKR
ncbi:MAG: TIGR03790 family protein [Verrucomicrobiales bacterium]